MKHLALTAIILAALFSLSSCQKGIDEIPETTEPTPPAAIQSIIESPDGKKLLLTKFEEINETYQDEYYVRYQYNAAGALKEMKEFDKDGEESGTGKVSYDNQKVTMILTPRGHSWQDSITVKLAASGWPVSYESIETEDSKVQYSELETYTLNAEGYTTEENSIQMEHPDDPLGPTSKVEERRVYFYEGGNLAKVEVYAKGSSTTKQVLLFEYDNNKPNLLKNFADFGKGYDFQFRRPSKNLLVKAETWKPGFTDPALSLTTTTNYTYTMNANGLPAEVSVTGTYHSSIGPVIDSRYKMKFTYTEL